MESGQRLIDYNKAAKDFFRALNISLDNHSIEHLFDRKPELLEIFKSETTQEFSVMIDGEKRFFEISSLSGLYNRAEFMNLAQRELSGAKELNKGLSLLMIDIDFFKNINDTYGHAAGDEVVREMGNMIKTNFRKTDFAGRLGGEEFAVLLKDISLEEAKSAAEKFRETVSRSKVVYEKQEIRFTVSIGVAATGGNSDIEDVLKQADNALYKAKAKGRNCVVTAE